MAYETFSERDIQNFRYRIMQGDTSARDELLKEAKRLAKASNSRLLRIEKADLTRQSQAYQLADFYISSKGVTGKTRYRINNSYSNNEIIDSIREMRTFLSKESSTVRGLRYAQKRTLDILEDYGISVEEKDKTAFYEYIRSDTVQDVIDYIGEYDVVMDFIANNIDKKKMSFQQLEQEFNAFLNSSEKFDLFFDRLNEKYKGGLSYADLQRRTVERDIYNRKAKRRSKG